MDSQFLLRYCLYSLPGKWVYYFERSEHGNRYGTKTDYLFQFLCQKKYNNMKHNK
ncbi:NADH dehydrogenase [ubiquinone] iron-sulfur protein, putative [Medicago truncatula]|uniref:NADH dehydrogenase [ubiquinone] iron-sulfur protein, putative n=1 Tax=Medicago truncatula TaxID=3880 RepID=G7LCU5_MEDTR|nr:NADH dehydrogenase [ubiquinone] iron-sulfur protein, putative [Medicago truncatula]